MCAYTGRERPINSSPSAFRLDRRMAKMCLYAIASLKIGIALALLLLLISPVAFVALWYYQSIQCENALAALRDRGWKTYNVRPDEGGQIVTSPDGITSAEFEKCLPLLVKINRLRILELVGVDSFDSSAAKKLTDSGIERTGVATIGLPLEVPKATARKIFEYFDERRVFVGHPSLPDPYHPGKTQDGKETPPWHKPHPPRSSQRNLLPF